LTLGAFCGCYVGICETLYRAAIDSHLPFSSSGNRREIAKNSVLKIATDGCVLGLCKCHKMFVVPNLIFLGRKRGGLRSSLKDDVRYGVDVS